MIFKKSIKSSSVGPEESPPTQGDWHICHPKEIMQRINKNMETNINFILRIKCF